MKPYFYPIFLFLLPLATAAERQIQCKVVGISDGDTLTCLFEHKPLKVRLQHIDAPESAQPFGKRAKQTLSNLAFKQEVKLLVSGYDKYDRLLAVVYNYRNENLNLKLVEQGMAWAYRQTQPIYQQAQERAQTAKLGLWQDRNPINPADWRANKRSHSTLNLPMAQSKPPVTGTDCSRKLSCAQMEKQGFSYAQAQHYFQQCGRKELDGNGDGIPCNKLYRKAQQR